MHSLKRLYDFNFKTLYLLLLLLLCIATGNTYAQEEPAISLAIGDTAPPLKIKEWVKGAPVTQFEKGKVYVLEFWASWCRPCKAAMPHLSALANKYRNKVTIIGVDVLEQKNISDQKIKSFVDSMGLQMDYTVAIEESPLMETGWLLAFAVRREGIPRSFVINAEGKVAWIGHPKDLAEVLPKIVDGSWDIKAALNKRNADKRLKLLDLTFNDELRKYRENDFEKDSIGKPELALIAIDTIVKKEPALQYAPFLAYNTFTSLLKTNQQKAYEYGKLVLVTGSYEEPCRYIIYDAVDYFSNRLKLTPEIYELGADAQQLEIDHAPYPQLYNLSRDYRKMAAFYWRANKKSKAIATQQKAIEALQNTDHSSNVDIAAFKAELERYKKM